MKEQRHTEEREAVRAENLKESQKQKVFVDEFGQANPHVGTGSCRPATKGRLAESLKQEIATDFIKNLSTKLSLKFLDLQLKLDKKYGRIIALQLIDDQLIDIITEKFKMELDLRVQQIHEWFGEQNENKKTKMAKARVKMD